MSTTTTRPRRNQEPEPVRPWFARLFRRPAPAPGPTAAARAPFDPVLALTRDLTAAHADAARWKRYANSYDQDRQRALENAADALRDVHALHTEMAHLLAWLAALHPAQAVITPAYDDEPDGTQVLYLVAGGWQMSWPVGRELAPLFSHVTRVERTDPRAQWDGHGQDQIPERIRQHVRLLVLDGVRGDGALTPVMPGQRDA
ncbi:hypothetical protein [Streptomyces sp. NPDC002952]|uniref:hypothetical protein n=1 Tax=Streptomyces sp. NPDC002952 TaxID=3364673 RepID=UPI0036C75EB8